MKAPLESAADFRRKLILRARRLARQGWTVAWSGRRWRFAHVGLEPAGDDYGFEGFGLQPYRDLAIDVLAGLVAAATAPWQSRRPGGGR